jgi:hypothetical protein
MIDKEHIERHIIVKKDDEITSIEGVTHSNIYDEEVLYNALGYSIFDSLKLDNIIFEGWTDKVLLQTALKRIPSTYSNIKKPLSSIGLCHSQGVKSIKNVASLLELANRNYIIISDCDKPAIEKQKEYNELMYHGQWKKYDDFGIDIDIITCEDFLKVDAFKSPCKFIKNKYNFQYDLDFEKLNISKSKISVVEKWITENCSNNKGEILREFKLTLFDDLKPSYINENYYLFLKKMLEFYDSQIDSSNFAS